VGDDEDLVAFGQGIGRRRAHDEHPSVPVQATPGGTITSVPSDAKEAAICAWAPKANGNFTIKGEVHRIR